MPDDPAPEILDVAALAIDLATGGPAGSLAVLPIRAVVDFAHRIEERRIKRALALLIEGLATAGDLPPDEAAQRIGDLLAGSSDREDDLLYAAFRSMAYARSDAAWPYIARLTAEYLHHGQAADSFFKRASWLLERCEDEDVKLLVEAMQVSRMIKKDHLRRQETQGDGPLRSLVWKHKPVSNTGSHQIMIVASPSATPGVASSSPGEREGGEGWARLIALIREARIGYTDSNDQQVFTVEDNTFFKLMDLVLLGLPATPPSGPA